MSEPNGSEPAVSLISANEAPLVAAKGIIATSKQQASKKGRPIPVVISNRQSPDITSGAGIRSHYASLTTTWPDSDNSDEEELMDIEEDGDEASRTAPPKPVKAEDSKKTSVEVPKTGEVESRKKVWRAEERVILYRIMFDLDFNPTVSQRNFSMLGVHERFCDVTSTIVDPEVLWEHLYTLYDLKGLDQLRRQTVNDDSDPFILPDKIMKLAQEIRRKEGSSPNPGENADESSLV